MPTYEYVCDACGHAFERIQRMVDPAVRKCPECAKLKVRRLISGGAGVIFKGSGFYETDYKRKRTGADRGEGGEGGEGAGAPSKDKAAAKDGASSGESATKPAPGESSGGAKTPDAASSNAQPSAGPRSERSRKKDSAKRP